MRKNWKIMIVDDDKDVHSITKLTLKNLLFDNRKLKFISAYTSEDAKRKLRYHKDVAVMLLDVVMEEKYSGLYLVDFIRNKLNDTAMQIVLRTGYPSEAPEESVVEDYKINDYVEKGEVSSTRLRTSIATAIRSYNDISVLQRSCDTLTRLRQYSDNIGDFSNISALVKGVFRFMAMDKLIDNAALFYENKLIKTHNVEDEEELKNAFSKWKRSRAKDSVDAYVFVGLREFPGYVFAVKCNEQIGEELIKNLVKQAEVVRQNLIKIVNNPELLYKLWYVSSNVDHLIYVQSSGYNVIVFKTNEQKELKIGFQDILLYYEDVILKKVHRSFAVNLNNIKRYCWRDYRSLDLEMIDGSLIPVSKSYLKFFKKNLQYAL